MMLKFWKILLVLLCLFAVNVPRLAVAGTSDEKAITAEMYAAERNFRAPASISSGDAVSAPSPPPSYYGTNPSFDAIKAKLIAAGQKYHIPPHILFGIAFQESGWNQFRSDGRTVYHQEPDGRNGVGIMQMTISPSSSDYGRLCTDIDYNIDQGAALLIGKWNATPIIGDNDKAKLENWFYAIWAYNGFVCPNPNNYAPSVLANIANGEGKWTPVSVTKPATASSCPPPKNIPLPSPTHVDANFDGVIDGSNPPTSPPDWDGYLDVPANGAAVSGVVRVTGWARDKTGRNPVSKVEIFVNDEKIGDGH